MLEAINKSMQLHIYDSLHTMCLCIYNEIHLDIYHDSMVNNSGFLFHLLALH